MIIKNANLIPMNEEKVLSGYDMLIGEGLIKKISRHIEADSESVLDCTGKFIIPGLFDCHIHLDTPMAHSLLLANGVTSVRNMYGRPRTLELKKAIDSGETDGPTIYTTGPIIDCSKSELKEIAVADTPEMAREAVRETIRAGYNYVKTYPDIPKDAFFALMDEAKATGIFVAGHGNWHVTWDELIQSGYDSLEHTSCLPKNDEDIIKLAHAGLWFTPTLVALQNLIAFVNVDKKIEELFPEEYLAYVDEKTLESWNYDIVRCRNTPRFHTFTNEEFYRKTRLLAENTDRVLLGTDSPMPGVIAGFSLHTELRNLVDFVGMTPYQALSAGTVRPVKCMNITDKKGMLKEAMDADMVILNGNPLSDIKSSSDIFAVIKSGKLYDRNRLDNMLIRAKKS